jgi:hypothetical protein
MQAPEGAFAIYGSKSGAIKVATAAEQSKSYIARTRRDAGALTANDPVADFS